MKERVKRVALALGEAVMLILFLGGPLFFLFLYGSLGGLPLYVTKIIPIAGGVLLLSLLLVRCIQPGRRWTKRIWTACMVVCLGCGIYVGHGLYEDSIPTIDDRELLLSDYIPFQEGTKAVKLEEEAPFRFAWTQRPRLDGATALYPVYAAFVQAVYPEGYNENDYWPQKSGQWVRCSGTIQAYSRLIRGETEMIFAAGPSQAQLEAAEKAGVQLHLTPIGREAFVFFVNSKNPVTGLTVEQIQGIYTGEITNWSQVGGKNQSIRPFQRAENSGSQTALQNLMAGLPLMEPEERDRIGGMGGIISEVASYKNYKNAIGFSFRYYATEMEAEDEIRLLALNGVAPTKETIRDGSYPIASEFYAVTASRIGQPAPQEDDPELAALLDWILSDQGQEIIERTGYVSLNG